MEGNYLFDQRSIHYGINKEKPDILPFIDLSKFNEENKKSKNENSNNGFILKAIKTIEQSKTEYKKEYPDIELKKRKIMKFKKKIMKKKKKRMNKKKIILKKMKE